jgi:hypothetical protein
LFRIKAEDYAMLIGKPLTVRTGGFQRLFQRLGLAGLLFFTVKGMLWLTLPVLLAWFF